MRKWLICVNCGKEDVSVPGHTGTRQGMHCPDCSSNDKGLASCCRRCCPTEHGCCMPPAHLLTPASEYVKQSITQENERRDAERRQQF